METRICRECGKEKPLEAFELVKAERVRTRGRRGRRGGIGVGIRLGEVEYPACRECVEGRGDGQQEAEES